MKKYPNSTDLTKEDREELERLLAHEKKVRPHLISRYEFILAGALDVDPRARKSLSWGTKDAKSAKPVQSGQLDLFSSLDDKEVSPPEDQPRAAVDGDDEDLAAGDL